MGWLKDRYGSQEKLQTAWGDALSPKETLAEANVAAKTNPWFFGSDHLPGAERRRAAAAARHGRVPARRSGSLL